jgi:hypothetical protein
MLKAAAAAGALKVVAANKRPRPRTVAAIVRNMVVGGDALFGTAVVQVSAGRQGTVLEPQSDCGF